MDGDTLGDIRYTYCSKSALPRPAGDPHTIRGSITRFAAPNTPVAIRREEEHTLLLAGGIFTIIPKAERAVFRAGEVFQGGHHMRAGHAAMLRPRTSAARPHDLSIRAELDRHDMICGGIGGTLYDDGVSVHAPRL